MDVKETRKLSSLVIYSYQKTEHLERGCSVLTMYVKGVPFVNRRYTEGVPSL